MVKTPSQDSRGASLVEYVLLVGVVALVALAGVRGFGGAARARAAEDSGCVASLGAGCREGTSDASSAVGTSASAITPERASGRANRDGWYWAGGIARGFALQAWDTVKGLATLVGAVTPPGIAYYALRGEPNPAVEAGVGLAKLAFWATPPMQAYSALTGTPNPVDELGRAIGAQIKASWRRDPAETLGRGAFEIATFVVPVARAATAAREGAEVAEVAPALEDAARAGSAEVGATTLAEQASLRQAARVEALDDPASVEVASDEITSRVRANEFITTRGLTSGDGGSYRENLGQRFVDRVSGLRSGDHWVDMGAGDAQAIREYYGEVAGTERARTTALAFARPTDPAFAEFERTTPEFKSLYGRMLSDYEPGEIPPATLVSDVYGPFAYADHMDQVLGQYAQIAEKGGEIDVYFPNQTVIMNDLGTPAAREAWAREWIGQGKGLEVVDTSHNDGLGFNLVVKKTADETEVAPLTLRGMRAGAPPVRIYKGDW